MYLHIGHGHMDHVGLKEGRCTTAMATGDASDAAETALRGTQSTRTLSSRHRYMHVIRETDRHLDV